MLYRCLSVLSIVCCTGLFVWGLEVCAHRVLGGVCVYLITSAHNPQQLKAPPRTSATHTPPTTRWAQTSSPHTNRLVQHSIDRTDKHVYNTVYSHYTTFHIILFITVQKTICFNSTSNTPDDARMYPKHVELRIHQCYRWSRFEARSKICSADRQAKIRGKNKVKLGTSSKRISVVCNILVYCEGVYCKVTGIKFMAVFVTWRDAACL